METGTEISPELNKSVERNGKKKVVIIDAQLARQLCFV